VLHVEVQQSGAKVTWWGEPSHPDWASDRTEQASEATGEASPSDLAEVKGAPPHPCAW